jgi:hypothetical protein
VHEAIRVAFSMSAFAGPLLRSVQGISNAHVAAEPTLGSWEDLRWWYEPSKGLDMNWTQAGLTSTPITSQRSTQYNVGARLELQARTPEA